MNPVLLATGLAVVAGAIVAVSVRDARWALAGLAVCLAGSALVADPLPILPSVVARLVSVALGTYLLWVTVRATTTRTRGSVLVWPANALAAGAAFLVGLGTPGLGGPAVGPAEAEGVAFALAALAVGPVVFGRDVFRVGVGLVLMVTAAELARVALAGVPAPLEQLVVGGLTVALLGALAALCANAFSAAGGFDLGDRRRSPFELAARQPGDSFSRPTS